VSTFPSALAAPSITGQGTIRDIFTVRDITRRGTIGGLPGTSTTVIPIGIAGTGGIAAGITIEILSCELLG
jgi:hypothetical protein